MMPLVNRSDGRMRFENGTAVVTGGGSGIGRAICLAFAREGARVAVLDINAASAHEVADECGAGAAGITCDVADAGSVTEAFHAVVRRLGEPEWLVNNAGTAHLPPDVARRMVADAHAVLADDERDSLYATTTLTDEVWDRTLRVHLYGTFFCVREALRLMQPRRTGAIVNMTSTSALRGQAPTPDYSAAKGGIISLTKALALEVVGAGIRVNAIAPGWVDTPMTARLDPELRRLILTQIPQARFGHPDEIAALALYLCSDEASYMTGQIVSPNGGLYT